MRTLNGRTQDELAQTSRQSHLRLLPSRAPSGRLPLAATVRAVHAENYRIKTFTLDAEMPEARPGQFVMAWLPGHEEAPFSLAYDRPVTLTVARVGPFTEALHRLQVGDHLWLRGPFGRPFHVEPDVKRPLLVGGGYGVAPLGYLAEMLLAHGQRPVALIGGRTAADIIGVKRFAALGVPVIATTESEGILEDAWCSHEVGVITEPTARLLRTGGGDAIYGVGPHGMLEALQGLAWEWGVSAQLSWEAYMGCAIGLCGMCEHTDGSLLCVEGPVRRVQTKVNGRVPQALAGL